MGEGRRNPERRQGVACRGACQRDQLAPAWRCGPGGRVGDPGGTGPSRSWQPQEREEATGVCVLSPLWSAPCSPELPTQSGCPRCCSEYTLSAGLSTFTRRCLVTLAPQSTRPSAQSPPWLPPPSMNPTGATWRTLLNAGFVSLLCGLRQWLGLSGQRDRHSRTIQPSPPLEET